MGFHLWSPGELAWIEIKDGDSFESLPSPSREDLVHLCTRYDFDLEETMKVIDERNPDQHGIMIEAEKWRESCKEKHEQQQA